MKTLNIIMAFCFGLMIGYFFFKSQKEKLSVNQHEIITENKLHLQTIDSNKFNKDKRYELLANQLKTQLSKAQQGLSVSKKQLHIEKEKVNQLVFQLKANHVSKSDTLIVDSLHFAIQSLNMEMDTVVNLYENKLKYSNNLVAVRDSQLVMCNKTYYESKVLLNEQFIREQKLTNDLNSTLKELRKKRNQNRVLCAGMLFITGLTTALFLKTKI